MGYDTPRQINPEDDPMPKDQRKRQEKMMKRRMKQKNKKKQAARASFGHTEKAIIRRARSYPIIECLINEGWQEQGIASILISRRQSDSLVILGSFNVDLFCLGVKDAFARANMPLATYHELKEKFIGERPIKKCSPELAHQIIYGAIDYAALWDLKPHKDFLLARNVLEPREDIPATEDIEFGKDGKPFFIAGPYDNVSRILKHLENKLGPDGFQFMILEDGIKEDEYYDDDEYFDEEDD